ncbi:TonB-dependent receptor [Luminiphilus sp.]|nr:TonB-dependent receptor [Luminiphilus sp.]
MFEQIALYKMVQSRINNVRPDMLKTRVNTFSMGAPRSVFSRLFIATCCAVGFVQMSWAQQEDASDESATGAIEEVVVTGIREVVKSTIDLKRSSVQIVDGLSSDQIGDIPALSVGDALETITGATSHQENGVATELSVRGLGPFLGTTVVNGREATNGGGNRAVNFSIFPSEMFNKIAIHKSQSAEYIEGAVSGQIHLDTKRPLKFGKRFLQVDVKAAHSPDEANIIDGQEFGSRATVGYIDQFELSGDAMLGVSLGIQVRDESNPEQEYQTTSGQGRLEACELTSFDSNALPLDTSGRCHDNSLSVQNDRIQGLIDSNPNYNSPSDIPFAYIPRDHRYRQNTTDDEREAVFGSVQFQPNDRLDIMFDFQYSERDQREMRRDLQWGSTQEDISALTSNPYTGIVTSSVSETTIHSYTTDFQRLEEYEGFGLNVDFLVTDRLTLNLDYAESETKRTETDIELRLGASDNNLVGGNRDDFTVQLDTQMGGGVALATILNDGGNGFEVTDPSYFNARDRARVRARQIARENTLDAFRADLTWDADMGAIHTIKAGTRLSTMAYTELGGLRNAPGQSLFEDEDLVSPNGGANNDVTDGILSNVLACANSQFPESGFLSNVANGNIIGNASSGSAVSEYATFDFDCAVDAWLVNYGGQSAIQFQNGITSGATDVEEDTTSLYIQAEFDSMWGDTPIRGNFGVRYVDTEITSVGYRGPITVEEIDGVGFVVTEGDASVSGFETDTQVSSYQEWLPSITVVADVNDDLVFRMGAFRGMSRPDPHSYGNGRAVQDNDESNAYTSLSEAINGISATGNPYLKPILSNNLDVGLEWYPSESTMVAGLVYWKNFNAQFQTAAQVETFNLDGNRVQGVVETTQISNDTSTIKGFEVTAIHSFDYLPGFWSGFGGKISYNYADSDFEYEDQYGGDGVGVSIDRDTGEVTQTPLLGILPPANLFGLSENVSSVQLYWSNDKWNAQAIHNRRSGYFQQFTRDAFGRVRYTDSNARLDLRVRYKLTDNIRISFEAKNVLDEARRDSRAIDGNAYQALSFGPRLFLGLTAKF